MLAGLVRRWRITEGSSEQRTRKSSPSRGLERIRMATAQTFPHFYWHENLLARKTEISGIERSPWWLRAADNDTDHRIGRDADTTCRACYRRRRRSRGSSNGARAERRAGSSVLTGDTRRNGRERKSEIGNRDERRYLERRRACRRDERQGR